VAAGRRAHTASQDSVTRRLSDQLLCNAEVAFGYLRDPAGELSEVGDLAGAVVGLGVEEHKPKMAAYRLSVAANGLRLVEPAHPTKVARIYPDPLRNDPRPGLPRHRRTGETCASHHGRKRDYGEQVAGSPTGLHAHVPAALAAAAFIELRQPPGDSSAFCSVAD
jgi:hypothetical protein